MNKKSNTMMFVVALLLSFLSFSGFTPSTQTASVKAQTTLFALKDNRTYQGITYQQALKSSNCPGYFFQGVKIKHLFTIIAHSVGIMLVFFACVYVYRGIKKQLLHWHEEYSNYFNDPAINL